MIKKYISIIRIMILIIILTPSFHGQKYYAQSNMHNDLPSGLSKQSKVEYTDTPESIDQVKKNYWLPAASVIGLNFGVWGYHRYLSGESWSNISWETTKNNFKTGFQWDFDGYLMNQFLHPLCLFKTPSVLKTAKFN
jgi:hypothetical protein